MLHGNVAMICEHGLDLLKQLLPPRIEVLRAGQTVEMSGLDSVDQLDRLTACGDQVEPSPRNHQAIRQSKDAISDGMPMMMVVKQPAVDIALAQGGLNGGKVHGQISILNNCSVLSELGNPRQKSRAGFLRRRQNGIGWKIAFGASLVLIIGSRLLGSLSQNDQLALDCRNRFFPRHAPRYRCRSRDCGEHDREPPAESLAFRTDWRSLGNRTHAHDLCCGYGHHSV